MGWGVGWGGNAEESTGGKRGRGKRKGAIEERKGRGTDGKSGVGSTNGRASPASAARRRRPAFRATFARATGVAVF
jgi:hypothetical protein